MKKIYKLHGMAIQIAKNPFFASSLIMIVGSNFGNVFAFLYHFIIARQLADPALFGEVGAVISLIALVSAAFTFLAMVVAKFVSVAKTKKEIEAVFSWFLKWGMIIGIGVALTALVFNGVVSQFLHVEANITVLIAPILLFSVLAVVLKSFLQGGLRFGELALVSNLELLLRLCSAVVFVALGMAVFGAILGILVALIVSVGLMFFLLREYRIDIHIKNFDQRNQILKFALPALVFSVTSTSFLSVDVILAKHFLGAHDAGLYAALSTLGKIILYGAGPIGAVMFPMISKKHAAGESYRKVFLLSAMLTLVGSVFAILIFWLIPQLLIQILYGEKYIEGAVYLASFGMFAGVFSLCSVIVSMFMSTGRTRIVVFPLVFCVVQIAGIILYHDSIATIIHVSLGSAVLLLVALLVYLKCEKPGSRQ